MSEYHDRGILKWAPFDALSGHRSTLEDLIYNLNKKEKASLSEDENKEFNETVAKAVRQDKPISLEYYRDGYSYSTFGKIKKADDIKKVLVLDTEEKISFDDVLRIEIAR